MTVLLAVFSMLAQGTSDFVYKRAQDRGIVLETYMMIETLPFSGVALLGGFLIGNLTINPPTVVFGLISGVVSYWSIFCFVTSLREGEVGVNTLIFRLNFVWVAVIAILWMGEVWTLPVVTGLVFAVLAVGCVTLLDRRKGAGSSRSIGLAFLAMALFAVLNLLFKIGIRQGAGAAWMVVLAAASWLLCAAGVAVFRRRFSMPRGNWVYPPLTGALKSAAFFALLYAFRRGGNASVVVPIAQLSFLVTIAWAALVLREKLTRSKVIGLLLAVAAIVAFAS